jgi:DNA-directed RNA polymerase subunit RPC12/RpoP
MLLRATAIWFLLLVLAIVNGGARASWITPRWVESIGHWVSTAIFCSVILIVAWVFAGWIRPALTSAAWQVGLYGPPMWYVDQKRNCRDCGKEFAWTARKQQHWFEILKIPIQVQALRCPACGRKLKLAKEAQKRHMAEMARRPRHPNEAFLRKARPAKAKSST